MVTAIEVAKHLVWLAGQESEPAGLTPMQLQKLLYYVQGWSLALLGKPAFGEHFEAWRLGPVVCEVYGSFAGREPIPLAIGSEANFDPDEAFLVRAVWEAYKKYSAIGLSEKTHAEGPWRDARVGLEPQAASDREISLESLRAYFESQLGKSEDFFLQAMPAWSRRPDERFVQAAQTVMARRLAVLHRLAQ